MTESVKFTAVTPIDRTNLPDFIRATGTGQDLITPAYLDTVATTLKVDEGKCTPTTAAAILKEVGARDMAAAVRRLIEVQ